MPDYKETDVVGKYWQRASEMRCRNPFDAAKSVVFTEERIASLGAGATVTESLGNLVETLTAENALEAFPVKHPVTGELLMTCTFELFYAISGSLYHHLAAKRDAAVELAEQNREEAAAQAAAATEQAEADRASIEAQALAAELAFEEEQAASQAAASQAATDEQAMFDAEHAANQPPAEPTP